MFRSIQSVAVSATAGLGFVASPTVSETWLVQLPVAAGFVALVVWMLKLGIKQEEKRDARWQVLLEAHDLRRSEDIKGSIDSMSEVSASLRSLTKTNARLAAAIVYHDATVKGVNPTTLGSPEEILKKITEL